MARFTCLLIIIAHVREICNINSAEYFLSDIFRGQRRFIKRSEMKKAYCPRIEGLDMPQILGLIRQHPSVLEYLPEEEEITRVGREFVCNVIYTLKPDEFNAFVREKEQFRRAKMDTARNNTV